MVAANERFGRRPRAVIMLVALLGATGAGQAADRFVSNTGGDSANDCLGSGTPCATIGHALMVATSGDVIKVTGGLFVENLLVDFTTALTVSGGWTEDFLSRDPVLNETTVAGNGGPVLSVYAETGEVIDVAVDGLVITGALPPFGVTGGIVTTSLGDGSVTLTVIDCVLTKNLVGLLAESRDTSGLDISLTGSTVSRNLQAGLGVS